jgi:hypothetical protein
MRGALGFLLLALAVVAGFSATSGQTTTNSTVRITLPGDGRFAFKDGPGKAVAQQYCIMCHSTAYVSTQPLLNHDQWTAEVVKMQKVYGAPIPDTAIAPIADYLTLAYGAPGASAPPTVPTAVPSGGAR